MSSAANTMFRASRPVFRQGTIHAQARQAFRANQLGQRFRQGERRWQSGSGAAGAEQSWFKRMWESEVGIKTVHFWYAFRVSRYSVHVWMSWLTLAD